MNPFDFVKNVNKGKSGENLFQNETADNNEGQNDVESFSKNYTPFIINRALSYFPDSALFANEMNRYAHLAPKMQYDFLRNTLRPRNRYSKWQKKAEANDDVKLIQMKYNCSREKAEMFYPIFPESELKKLRETKKCLNL